MKLFDNIDENQEEVVIRESEEEESPGNENEKRLEQEVGQKVANTEDSGSIGSETQKTGMDLPGMEGSSGSSSGDTGSSRDSEPGIEDIHDQNKRIISLLEDIKDEVGGGSGNELL